MYGSCRSVHGAVSSRSESKVCRTRASQCSAVRACAVQWARGCVGRCSESCIEVLMMCF